MEPPFETELKFQVPPGQRAAVLRSLQGRGVERVHLVARYFDTADGRLATAGLALRLRREGRARWVQTLKGRGDGLMQRLEHEVVLGAHECPALDLARHDGTSAGDLLRQALGSQALVERFATDIVRTRRRVSTRGAAGRAAVEIAFDSGHVRAGRAERAVCELEFELLDGAPRALLALASRWVVRHGLWLDVRSKAEVGHRLAGTMPAPVVAAAPPIVSARMGPRRALAALLQSCLAQVLPNHAELAAPLGPAAAETVHQLRVGLRRTRTALREFGRGVDGVDAAWGETLARAFRDLGAQRDRDVIAATLAAGREAARAAGLGTVPDPAGGPAGDADPAAMLRTAAFNTLLLELIGFVVSAAVNDDDGDGGASLQPRARERLKRLHRQVCAPAARFAVLPDDERHRLRKRAKRLRYALEFCAPLLGRKAVARYLGLLRGLQQALGDLNDLVVADAWLAGEAPTDAGRAFLRGWVAARRETLLAQGAAALRALARADRPWA